MLSWDYKKESEVIMMKKMMKRLIVFALILSVITVTEGAVTASAKKIDSFSAAKKKALKKVPSATVTELDTDMENGALVYDVELLKKNKEYKLKYRASDGKLLEYGWETVNPKITDQTQKDLSRSAITKKAKKQVKGATVRSVKLKQDDGISQYKIKLTKGSKKYELAYNSKTGKLLDYEWEITVKKSSASKTGYIGVEKAKSIALSKAPNATVVKVEFDKDDGVAVYEVDMVEGKYEYEVEINAKTGQIIKFEKEIDD